MSPSAHFLEFLKNRELAMKRVWRRKGGGIELERQRKRSSQSQQFLQQVLTKEPKLPPLVLDASWNRGGIDEERGDPLLAQKNLKSLKDF